MSGTAHSWETFDCKSMKRAVVCLRAFVIAPIVV